MKKIRSTASFSDVQSVLDAVCNKATFPARYTLSGPREAINWRHRANTFRQLLRRNEEAAWEQPPGSGTSPYDHLVFQISGPTVIIAERTVSGTLEINNEPVSIEEIAPAPVDPTTYRSALEDIDDD